MTNLRLDRSRLLSRRGRRGFTLIELLVVVVIIAILAVIAIPAITGQMRDRRTRQAAQEVARVYRGARMRAMGRGAAVVVRYTQPTAAGQLQVREAVRGSAEADPNCSSLPVSSCFTPNWASNGTNRLLETFDPTFRSEFRNVSVELDAAPADQNVSQLDICFTPLGRAYVSKDQGLTFQPLTTIPVARVWREDDGGNPVGLQRTVMILPNGSARLGVADVRAP